MRDNLCPICQKLLGRGLGPIEVKCSSCKAVVRIEPNKLVILQLPNYTQYLTLYSLGKTTKNYSDLRDMEVPVRQ